MQRAGCQWNVWRIVLVRLCHFNVEVWCRPLYYLGHFAYRTAVVVNVKEVVRSVCVHYDHPMLMKPFVGVKFGGYLVMNLCAFQLDLHSGNELGIVLGCSVDQDEMK